ncbi:threonyl-tRNA synthetase [Candidatus Kinetoplastibacterium oncopeltii TCC290E]|uniref:Threonine--tRNA ligase n=1 Tax=Candidatus Kinetoplastidibacterium stringomonadis TCC290E TaxID=1208920 RepID=M1LVY4_9PROT|nr:threonine--tRNA ligase [Candidatus Kinetoplastibacterium oncopeltii]AGF48231.1 threonyl-tRNA synthetase [Candidatus Kinetoplastibacterium oncopeltii TCC290E]
MIIITFPDGVQLSYKDQVTVSQLIRDINCNPEEIIAAQVDMDGKQLGIVNTKFSIKSNAQVRLIKKSDSDWLTIIRHSTAHLLAYAIKELFKDAQIAIGPVIENGFYYDISCKKSFSEDDLDMIEKRMMDISLRNEDIIREEWDRNYAIDFFKDRGEFYKIELISKIPTDEKISIYREGVFVDLCKGPHVPSTGYLKYFKLLKLSGAYWHGDSNNEMLQRIYGTAWVTKNDLNKYLEMLKLAENNDHRKIGKDLDLFHFQEEAPGLVFWHTNGLLIWQQVEYYMRDVYYKNGYKEVKAPQIIDVSLWKKTGHWENYRENMFTVNSENRTYALKPMNCPGHIQIFNSKLHSYKELPVRYGEFGNCHRNESSGSLHGLMRLRGFTQDDGHIFCTENQIHEECTLFTKLLQKVYMDFGFNDITYSVATRPKKRIGSNLIWDKAESALMESLNNIGCNFSINKEEGAFYGPKIEYTLKDAIGRSWQCGTIQVDFSMPNLLDAEYVDSDDCRQNPVMIHRAILGSMERFIGILIEHYSGAMPLWLAPVQVVICCISEQSIEYAKSIYSILLSKEFRVEIDLRNEKIGRKIREHSIKKIPYIIVVGENEKNNVNISVRCHGSLNLGLMSLEDFIIRLHSDISMKRVVAS